DRDVSATERSVNEQRVENRRQKVELQLNADCPKASVEDTVTELAHEVRVIELQYRSLGKIEQCYVDESNVHCREVASGGNQQEVDQDAYMQRGEDAQRTIASVVLQGRGF